MRRPLFGRPMRRTVGVRPDPASTGSSYLRHRRLESRSRARTRKSAEGPKTFSCGTDGARHPGPRRSQSRSVVDPCMNLPSPVSLLGVDPRPEANPQAGLASRHPSFATAMSRREVARRARAIAAPGGRRDGPPIVGGMASGRGPRDPPRSGWEVYVGCSLWPFSLPRPLSCSSWRSTDAGSLAGYCREL